MYLQKTTNCWKLYRYYNINYAKQKFGTTGFPTDSNYDSIVYHQDSI